MVVQGLGFRVQGLGFRVLGFRVLGFRVNSPVGPTSGDSQKPCGAREDGASACKGLQGLEAKRPQPCPSPEPYEILPLNPKP